MIKTSQASHVIAHYTISDCKTLGLPCHYASSGTLCVAQNDGCLPFEIKRVFFITNLASDAIRGGHSHISSHEIIIAASGSFTVELTDGITRRDVTLTNPSEGLYIPPGIWRTLKGFSPSAVSLVLSSELFDEGDYIRDKNEFIRQTNFRHAD